MKITIMKFHVILVMSIVIVLFQFINLNHVYAGPCDSPIDSQADTDSDGYLDTIECPGKSGITMTNGITLLMSNDSTTSIKPCQEGDARIKCIDAMTKDLFAIIDALDSYSKFPDTINPVEDLLEEFFDEIFESETSGGLGVSVHPAIQDTSISISRNVTADQKAIKITEKNDPLTEEDPELGTTAQLGGTPNGTDEATVYTFKIVEFMCGVCGRPSDFDSENGTCSASTWGTSNCKDNSEATGDTLIKNFVRHVNSHEIGHNVKLANSGNPMDEYHYPPENEVMMSSTTTFTKKGKKVTFYLPTNFTEGSTATLK